MFICSHHVFLQAYFWHQEATGNGSLESQGTIIKIFHVLKKLQEFRVFCLHVCNLTPLS